jgi:hypothetical protein
VTGDFTMEEYLYLQQLVYRVYEAIREEIGAERMYIYTFGSTRATPTPTGTWCLCRPGCLTRSSRAPGQVGARACSRYLPRRWRTWQDVSPAGSD